MTTCHCILPSKMWADTVSRLILCWLLLQNTMLDFVKLDPPKTQTLRSKGAEWRIKNMTTKRECIAHNIKQGTKIRLAAAYMRWKGDKKMADKVRLIFGFLHQLPGNQNCFTRHACTSL
jgi:hypothetical protein